MDEPYLSLRGLRKVFEGAVAVDDLSLDVARGELVLGGALADPPDMAILLFQGESPEAAEAFAGADPYVRNGLVRSWHVRPWTTVVGDIAATPVRPTR